MFWTNTTGFVLPQLERADGTARYMAQAAYELGVVDAEGAPLTELVASWNAEAPADTWLVVEARLQYAPADEPPEVAGWGGWHTLGRWGRGCPAGVPQQANAGDDPADAGLRLAVDTLRLDAGYEATAFQVRLTLHGGGARTPAVRLLAVSTTHRGQPIPDAAADPPLGRAVALPVPARSQRVERAAIAGEICSPTAVAMVMQFYGVNQPTEQVAAGVFDPGAGIYGNWPFNVAYAAGHGFHAVVRHFRTLGQIERELLAGRPVICSLAFEAGELPEAPIPRTDGHLIAVTGVTAGGDFLVNDPAADPRRGQSIARVYAREHLRRAFLAHGGVGYVIAPPAPEST